VPAGGGDDAEPELSFHVEASAVGVPVLGGRALDGSKPVRLGLMLVGDGETGDVEKPVRWEITPQKLVKVREAGDGSDDVLRPGDLADDKVLVRAMAADGAGPELARAEVPVRVLVPDEPLRRKVPLYRHESRRSDGVLRERYVYAKWEPDLPSDWKSEDGEIFHGDYEVFQGDGSTKASVRRYRYGVLHGKSESFDSKGRLVRETPYEDGLTHGDDVRYDPDSSGRQVFHFVKGRPTEETTSHADGKPASKITYEYEDHEPGGMDVTVRGEATQWWTSGKTCWTGRFERRGRIIDVPPFDNQGGGNGERVYKKVGTWKWFHRNGNLGREGNYRDGKQEGPYRSFDEQGRPLVVGQYANDLEEGRWLRHEYITVPEGIRHRVLYTVYVRGESKETGVEGE
jgi:antitoxin component YwqK of YwqJK toxin-antitoxin module